MREPAADYRAEEDVVGLRVNFNLNADILDQLNRIGGATFVSHFVLELPALYHHLLTSGSYDLAIQSAAKVAGITDQAKLNEASSLLSSKPIKTQKVARFSGIEVNIFDGDKKAYSSETPPIPESPSSGGAAGAASAAGLQKDGRVGYETFSANMIALLSPPSLQPIVCDFDRLKRARLRLALSDEKLNSYDKNLSEIEGYTKEINGYITGEDLSLFLSSIFQSFENIKACIRALEQLKNPKNRALVTSIVSSIESAIKKIKLEFSGDDDNDADLANAQLRSNTHGMHIQQSMIAIDTDQKTALIKLLQTLAKEFELTERQLQCFISYAWPTPQNRNQEAWVQLYLSDLQEQLRAAGLHALLDIKDNVTTRNIRDFAAKIKDSPFAISFCTESMKDKDASPNYRVVQRELNLLKEKHITDIRVYKQTRVFYVLGSGSHHTGYPEEYREYRTVYDWRERGYVKGLEALLRMIYNFDYPQDAADYKTKWDRFNALWSEFYTTYPHHQEALTPAAVRAAMRSPALNARFSGFQQAFQAGANLTYLRNTYLETAKNPALLEEAPSYGLPLENDTFTGREAQLTAITHQLKTTGQCVITGLAGVGKSSLALAYVHKARSEAHSAAVSTANYGYTVWLSGHNAESAFKSLVEDNQELGIKVASYKDDLPGLLDAFYSKLVDRYKNVLFVFDEVSDKEAIRPFLPRSQADNGKLHIIITTRSALNWEAPLVLSPLTTNDAKDYIRSILTTASEAAADALAKLLYNFPLALSQALAYMKEHACGIEDHNRSQGYLSLYREHADELLQQKPYKSDYKLTIYDTWYASIARMRDKNPKVIAFWKFCIDSDSNKISSESISAALSIPKGDMAYDALLIALRSESLITLENGQDTVLLHPLLQQVMRMRLQTLPVDETEAIFSGGAAAAARGAPTLFATLPPERTVNQEAVIAIVKKHGFDAVSDVSLQAALIAAVKAQEINDVKVLIKNVPDINAVDTNPFVAQTALHYAVIQKNLEIIACLLQANSRHDIEDAYGKTALDLANESSDPDIQNLFRQGAPAPK